MAAGSAGSHAAFATPTLYATQMDMYAQPQAGGMIKKDKAAAKAARKAAKKQQEAARRTLVIDAGAAGGGSSAWRSAAAPAAAPPQALARQQSATIVALVRTKSAEQREGVSCFAAPRPAPCALPLSRPRRPFSLRSAVSRVPSLLSRLSSPGR